MKIKNSREFRENFFKWCNNFIELNKKGLELRLISLQRDDCSQGIQFWIYNPDTKFYDKEATDYSNNLGNFRLREVLAHPILTRKAYHAMQEMMRRHRCRYAGTKG